MSSRRTNSDYAASTVSGSLGEELRSTQAPLKTRYSEDPQTARITLQADGSLDDGVACSVQTGRALVKAGLHQGTGGDGSLACSGDMLLEALVACAGVTMRAVATSLGIAVEGSIHAEGDLDWRHQSASQRSDFASNSRAKRATSSSRPSSDSRSATASSSRRSRARRSCRSLYPQPRRPRRAGRCLARAGHPLNEVTPDSARSGRRRPSRTRRGAGGLRPGRRPPARA